MPFSVKSFTTSGMLSTVLALDSLLFLGFGLVSWFAPHLTFATIVDLGAASDQSLISAALASLSIFYVLIGLACALAVWMPPPHRTRIAVVMALGHAWTGIKAYEEVGRDWLIGNPWPDIVIHVVFVSLYSLLVLVMWRRVH